MSNKPRYTGLIVGTAISFIGFVWSVYTFFSLYPYFALSLPNYYQPFSARAIYLFVAPESTLLFLLLLGLTLRTNYNVPLRRILAAETPAIALAIFMVPAVPVFYFIPHCGTYFVTFESVGYLLTGHGVTFTPAYCI
jgi:hypothetical protein